MDLPSAAKCTTNVCMSLTKLEHLPVPRSSSPMPNAEPPMSRLCMDVRRSFPSEEPSQGAPQSSPTFSVPPSTPTFQVAVFVMSFGFPPTKKNFGSGLAVPQLMLDRDIGPWRRPLPSV